jgi:hypothetical protein
MEKPNRFQVYRLNRSAKYAISTKICMNIKKSRFVINNRNKINLPIIVQISLRKFIEFILFYKNFIDLFLIKINKLSLNIFNFNVLDELTCISHFISKIFSLKKTRHFLCKRFQIHLISLTLIIDNWIEKIKYFMLFYEYLGGVNCRNNVKGLQSYIINNEDLFFQADKIFFSKVITLNIVLIVKKWIFKKKLISFPNWFFIKKYQHNKELLTSENVKIKIKNLPSFISILNAKKILIIGLWNNRFLFNLQYKKYLFTENSVITSLEDFVEYLGIKICEDVLNEIIKTFFLLSNQKKINFVLKENYARYFSNKTIKVLVRVNFRKLLKLSTFIFKKINNSFTTKIHKCFLNIYKKISLILFHLNKLEYSFNNIIFSCSKINTYYQKEYLKYFFILRMKFLSFIRIIKQIFTKQIVKNELKIFYKSIRTKKSSLTFFKECQNFIGKLHKIFFFKQGAIFIYETFIKIFSSIYSFKELLNLKKKKSYIAGKSINILSIDMVSTEITYVFHNKIKHFLKIFEKNISVFLSFIYSYHEFKIIVSGLNLNLFYFKKFLN